ncbi:hypothetical protein K8I31_16580 [bacterium]|nr:hypothetical protein [bacterium]
MMNRRFIYSFILTLLLVPTVYSQEAHLQRIWTAPLHWIDQHILYDTYIDGDSMYVLMKYYSFHQELEQMQFIHYDLSRPREMETCPFSLPCLFTYKTWKFNQKTYYDEIDPSLYLTNSIHQLGDYLYLPDNSGNSRKFDKNLNEISFEPGFEEIKKQSQTIMISDQVFTLPITIFDHTYTDMITLNSTIVLISDSFYTVVGVEELKIHGSAAQSRTFERSQHFSPLKKIGRGIKEVHDRRRWIVMRSRPNRRLESHAV